MQNCTDDVKPMAPFANPGMASESRCDDAVLEVMRRLLRYCEANDWAGYDPYDALNSELFKSLPTLDNRFGRLAWTQMLKRMVFNVRPFLRIPKTQNAKAFALFLSSYLKLHKSGLLDHPEHISAMIDNLATHRSPGVSHWCWGYSFPWQTRTKVVPRAVPNLVCTTFAANALLDAYELIDEARCLEMAVSAADFILTELYWNEGGAAGFAYPLPSMRQQIHNANLLAAALFCRVGALAGEKRFLEPAFKAARWSAGKQREDGSWAYGELPQHQWVDNFHTSYNLCALRDLGRYARTDEFASRVRRGFDFYRAHFFRADGAARYFHDRTYPIDVHCVASGIITPLEFSELHPDSVHLARSAFHWALKHLWDERGYFYYRKLRSVTIRIPYMRWGQAWMLLAVCKLLETTRANRVADSKRSVLGRESASIR